MRPGRLILAMRRLTGADASNIGSACCPWVACESHGNCRRRSPCRLFVFFVAATGRGQDNLWPIMQPPRPSSNSLGTTRCSHPAHFLDAFAAARGALGLSQRKIADKAGYRSGNAPGLESRTASAPRLSDGLPQLRIP
jgi:hypothetical protein